MDYLVKIEKAKAKSKYDALKVLEKEYVRLIEKYEKLAVKEREKVNQVYVLVHGEKCFSEEDINAFIEADVITAEQSDQYIEKLNQKREIAGETMQQTRSEAVCAILKKDLANLYDEIKYDLEPKLTGGLDEYILNQCGILFFYTSII